MARWPGCRPRRAPPKLTEPASEKRPAETDQPAGAPAVEAPQKAATSGSQYPNVLDFASGKAKTVKPAKSRNKSIVATGGRKRKTPEQSLRVEPLKSSKNRWLFRIRWTELDGSRPYFDVSRVSDQVYKLIRKDKRQYNEFKKQLISEFKTTVWRSREIRSSAGGAV